MDAITFPSRVWERTLNGWASRLPNGEDLVRRSAVKQWAEEIGTPDGLRLRDIPASRSGD